MKFATITSFFIAGNLVSGIAHASIDTCWEQASERYNIPVNMLKAIAKTESNYNPRAVNRNKDGSEDIGLVQINSVHLPVLMKYGIDRNALFDPCTNLMTGAWILSSNVARLGWNWNAIGSYNVGCKNLAAEECARRRDVYAQKIHVALHKVSVSETPLVPAPINYAPTDMGSIKVVPLNSQVSANTTLSGRITTVSIGGSSDDWYMNEGKDWYLSSGYADLDGEEE